VKFFSLLWGFCGGRFGVCEECEVALRFSGCLAVVFLVLGVGAYLTCAGFAEVGGIVFAIGRAFLGVEIFSRLSTK
jgi:hypothetical protein